MDVNDLIEACAKRLMVSASVAASIVARDKDVCAAVFSRKRALVTACGNCGKHHDYNGSTEGACLHLLALWDVEIAWELANKAAPMGVLACKGCSALGCDRCAQRGWFYPRGDGRAEADEERIEFAPALAADHKPLRRYGNDVVAATTERGPRKRSVLTKNKYASRCFNCKEHVGAFAGFVEPTRDAREKVWKVYCAACHEGKR